MDGMVRACGRVVSSVWWKCGWGNRWEPRIARSNTKKNHSLWLTYYPYLFFNENQTSIVVNMLKRKTIIFIFWLEHAREWMTKCWAWISPLPLPPPLSPCTCHKKNTMLMVGSWRIRIIHTLYTSHHESNKAQRNMYDRPGHELRWFLVYWVLECFHLCTLPSPICKVHSGCGLLWTFGLFITSGVRPNHFSYEG